MPIDPNLLNAFAGINLPQLDAQRRQNALGNLDLQATQQKVQGMMNPNATPEQLARSGNVDVANSVAQQQQVRQQNAMRYAGTRLLAVSQSNDPGTLMKQLASDPNFGSAAEAVGLPHPSNIDSFEGVDPNQLRQQAANLARILGATPPDYTLAKDAARFSGMNNQQVAAGPADPGNVEWKDVGDKLMPVYQGTGAPVPGLQPMPKQTPPAQQYTAGSVEDTAQMIYRGQLPALSGIAVKSPFGQQVNSRLKQLSDQNQAAGGNQYNAADFQSRAKAIRDFNTGQQGNSVRFMNVAVSHIGVLEDLGRALDNGDVKALNTLKNSWKTQTGQSAPTSFTAARDIVANEVVKAVTASGGSLADRQEAQAQISAASSWSQIADVAQTWKSLLAGQLGGLRQQYEQGTGMKDFNNKLYPETLRELGGLDKTQGGATALPQGVTEDDITETMRANRMTRDQVLQRLNAR